MVTRPSHHDQALDKNFKENPMMRRLLAGLIPIMLALSGSVHADIYAFVDSKGVRHLSNIPNDPRYKLVMRTPAYRKEGVRPTSSYAPLNLYGSGNVRSGNATLTRLSRTAESNRQRFAADIQRIAAQHRLDPALMHAVIHAESAYNPQAVSPKGATGLMQLMPATAARFGVSNSYDPVANMQGGARYLRWLLDRFQDTRLAVAAYNAGEGAVQRYGNQVPPFRETQTYVVRVLSLYQQNRAGGLYHTGATGSLAMSGNPSGRGAGGVTIITPRTTGNRSAQNARSTGNSRSGTTPRTVLPSSDGKIIVGSSDR
jgi:hypothetical protein